MTTLWLAKTWLPIRTKASQGGAAAQNEGHPQSSQKILRLYRSRLHGNIQWPSNKKKEKKSVGGAVSEKVAEPRGTGPRSLKHLPTC